jgi:hypothetical protein
VRSAQNTGDRAMTTEALIDATKPDPTFSTARAFLPPCGSAKWSNAVVATVMLANYQQFASMGDQGDMRAKLAAAAVDDTTPAELKEFVQAVQARLERAPDQLPFLYQAYAYLRQGHASADIIRTATSGLRSNTAVFLYRD